MKGNEMTEQKYANPGPWDDEPDSLDWEYREYRCHIKRHPSAGHLCGYASPSPEHPWCGKNYSDRVYIPDLENRKVNIDKVGAINVFCASLGCDLEAGLAEISLVLEAHGGITFSGPLDGQPDAAWWFGFDCAHCDDRSPGYDKFHRYGGDTYRDMPYVKTEVERLVDQLIEVATWPQAETEIVPSPPA